MTEFFSRTAVAVHRWLGVALCTVFLVWFSSGIGMMYWEFPRVTPADRLARAAALDPAMIRVSPTAAYQTLGRPEAADVELNVFDGRPVYRFRGRGGDDVVYADSGERRAEVSDQTRLRVAAAWAGQPPADARVIAVTSVDQWTVSGGLRTLRPLWKYSWPDGQDVYVDGSSGEVVQYTTRASRLGAYLGPIPHWLYFTPLRKHQLTWSRVVTWVSALATVSAFLGLVIGVSRYSPRKRYRHEGVPTGIPYRGQKRWHTALGLAFGVGTVSWAFSGMLSMDPFPRLARERRGGSGLGQTLRGRPTLSAFDARGPRRALEEIARPDVAALELTSFDGEAVYVATTRGGESLVVPLHGKPAAAFDYERLLEVARDGVRPELITEARVIADYDAYYLDRRRRRPLPVLLVVVGDQLHTRYYVDAKTANVVGSYQSRDWADRWLYHGLHSLDFPWLYKHRPLWDIVVIAFMAGGTALSATSIALAWRLVAGWWRGRSTGRRELVERQVPRRYSWL